MKLELSQVTKQYQLKNQEQRGIKDVSLTIKDSEFIGVCGASGSGKSTLFHVIAGILTPDKGSIVFDGEDITKLNQANRAKYRNQTIGYIMQGYHLLNHLTIRENLCIPYLFCKQKHYDLESRVKEVLRKVSLEAFENQYPGQLSGGEHNRIQIARALMNEPKLILADEPTQGLDAINANNIIMLLEEIASNGTAVMISSHQEQYLKHTARTYCLSR